MSLETEFADMFVDTVALVAPSGPDGYGRETYGAATNYDARVVRRTGLTVDDTGREVEFNAIVYVYGAPSVEADWQVTLPSGEQPRIVSVSRYPDRDGIHHVTLFCGDRRGGR